MAKMVKPTDVNAGAFSINYGCSTDADCTGELKTTTGTVFRAALTTAAEKA